MYEYITELESLMADSHLTDEEQKAIINFTDEKVLKKLKLNDVEITKALVVGLKKIFKNNNYNRYTELISKYIDKDVASIMATD